MQTRIAQFEGLLNCDASMAQKTFFAAIEQIDFLMQDPSATSSDRAALRSIKRKLMDKFELSGDSTADLSDSGSAVSASSFGIFSDIETNSFQFANRGTKKTIGSGSLPQLFTVKQKYQKLLTILFSIAMFLLCVICLVKFV